jgi:hypothetical protein
MRTWGRRPGVLPAQLLLLLLGVVVRDVEDGTYLLGCLALHHVSDLLAGRVEEPDDAEEVGGVDEVEERFLVLAEAVDELVAQLLRSLERRDVAVLIVVGLVVPVEVLGHRRQGRVADGDRDAACGRAAIDHATEHTGQPHRRRLRDLEPLPLLPIADQGDRLLASHLLLRHRCRCRSLLSVRRHHSRS